MATPNQPVTEAEYRSRLSAPLTFAPWQLKRKRELELIQRIVNGDRESWAEFVDRYAPMIHARVSDMARAFGLAKRPELIERITCFVFNSIVADNFAALKVYNGRSSLTAYLAVSATRVARRACVRIRQLRQQKRQQANPHATEP